MKKILMCLLSLILGLSMFACSPSDNGTITIYVPDGAPALAIAKLMYDDAKIGDKEVRYVVVNPSDISLHLQNGDADFAIVPTNLAANLYNAEAGYKLAATVTHGNLYIVGKVDVEGESIAEKIEALKGAKIGVIGMGQVPDLTFKYILNHYEITSDVTVSYLDASGAMSQLRENLIDFALFAEPAVARALANIDGSKIAFDLGEMWEDITGDPLYPQAGLVAKDSMDKDLIDELVQEMMKNETWAETHTEETIAAIASHAREGATVTTTLLNADIVKRCNVKIKSASDSKDALENYLSALGVNKMPDDDFYL